MPTHVTKEEVSTIAQGAVVFVGIGNTMRADDAFGPLLIERLQSKVRAACLDAGMSPENFIGKIIKLKPDTVIFLDAVSFDGLPGELKLVTSDEIGEYGFSTHNMSPKLMIENIKAQIATAIFMIGIQPKSVTFGGQISGEVQEQIDYLENIFLDILGNESK